MTSRSIAVVFCGLVACVAGAVASPKCDVNKQIPAERVFAKAGENDLWREYRTIQDIPDLDLDGGISAELWEGPSSSRLVRTVEPGEDFWIFTEYCFGKNGHLGSISFEFRTAWGWGYRLDGSITDSAIHAVSSEFFNTQNEKPISRPQGADDVSEALNSPW